MTFWERQNYGKSKKDQWLPRGVMVVEGFEMNRWSSEDF